MVTMNDGERVLQNNGSPLPLTIKDIISHWLAPVVRRLEKVPEGKWNTSYLGGVMKSTLDETSPHPKMVESDWTTKKIDIQLFLRWALIAGWSGPSNTASMDILGREITLQRLTQASKMLSE